MNSAGHSIVRRPGTCSPEQRADFAALVCEGFNSNRKTLAARLLAARWLGFHYLHHVICGIAAIKSPDLETRTSIFGRAGVADELDPCRLELGWVYVVPDLRAEGIASDLCRALVARAPTEPVFATTRSDNAAMQQILGTLGFRSVGVPFGRRNEELLLFFRPG